MATTKTLNKAHLDQFTGSEHLYRHALVRKIRFTDGAKYVADAGGAYWLLDAIAFAQAFEKAVAAEAFQFWKLKVCNETAILTCEDGNSNTVYRQKIEYTDFPLDEIAFYFTDNTILLTSEY